MFNLIKRSGRLAGIYTTYAGMLFGATWLLDRWLVWLLRRDVAPKIAAGDGHIDVDAIVSTFGPPMFLLGPDRCAVVDCPDAPVTEIHGWFLCQTHKPARGATITDARESVKVD